MLDALLFTKTNSLLTSVYRECLWKVDTEEKELFITFDDGPIPEVTTLILDILKEFDARATFFVIGKNAEAHPDILQRILDEGHIVGNHTYAHLNGWMHTNRRYDENIDECTASLQKLIPGFETKLFRPPYGKLKPSQYLKLKNKHRIVMWDVLSFDFDLKIEKEKVVSNVITYAEPGSIIVFHDSLKAAEKVLFALPKVLEHFTNLGYTFKSLTC